METTEVRAILFDTRSIQRYIFSGNELKTNIGASHIVDHIFDTVLAETLHNLFGSGSDTDSWRKADEGFGEVMGTCRIAYIGGGNALVLFRADTKDDVLKKVIRVFTEELLVRYPGLRTGAAIGKIDLSSTEQYRQDDMELHRLLKHYQNTVFPQVNIPYTGLTQACDVNDETADYYMESYMDGSARFISQEVAAKIRASKEANEELCRKFKGITGDCLFPMEIDKLGQKEPVNDMAVVHIDGNRMGEKFSQCATLDERVRLSKAVKEKTEQAFAVLLGEIMDHYDSYAVYLDLKQKDGTKYMPIRPLILGGDDVTFVCAAKLAVSLAKRFIEIMMEKNTTLPAAIAQGIDCCGGVAIMPTAYPFFRGYELAEQLCDAAKKKSRAQAGTSWLDFAILHGEQAPTLEQIREQEYSGLSGPLHFGPYKVNDPSYHYSLDKLLQCVQLFNSGKITKKDSKGQGLAKNKIKEMRDVLQRGRHDMDKFGEQLKHTGQYLPKIEGWEVYESDFWDKNQTPYIDAVELMDYVPEEE